MVGFNPFYIWLRRDGSNPDSCLVAEFNKRNRYLWGHLSFVVPTSRPLFIFVFYFPLTPSPTEHRSCALLAIDARLPRPAVASLGWSDEPPSAAEHLSSEGYDHADSTVHSILIQRACDHIISWWTLGRVVLCHAQRCDPVSAL